MSDTGHFIAREVKGTVNNMLSEPRYYKSKITPAFKNLKQNLKGLSKY